MKRVAPRIRKPLDLPPPVPAYYGYSRWPNGSAYYARRGTGDITQQWGWIVASKDHLKVFRRTGPNEDDIAFLGRAKDMTEASLLFPSKLWSHGLKGRALVPSTTVVPEVEEEQSEPDLSPPELPSPPPPARRRGLPQPSAEAHS